MSFTKENKFKKANFKDENYKTTVVNQQKLNRTAIKNKYNKVKKRSWERYLSQDKSLLNAKIKGETSQQDTWYQKDIEEWLCQKGFYKLEDCSSAINPRSDSEQNAVPFNNPILTEIKMNHNKDS